MILVHASIDSLSATVDSIRHLGLYRIPCQLLAMPCNRETTYEAGSNVIATDLEPAFYFLRLITFEHISIKPTFASLSGKLEIARAALSTYS